MPDSKITALTSISTSTDPANDPLVIVDVSDTSMAATGTTKKVTLNQLLGASGTATLASATITGDLTVASGLLKTDSANTRIGIGTLAPSYTTHIRTLSPVLAIQDNTSAAAGVGGIINFLGYTSGTSGANVFGQVKGVKTSASVGGELQFFTSDSAGNSVQRYLIDSTGVSTWAIGGSTAMTLNSTGLGVGGVPNAKVSCAGFSSANVAPDFQINRSSSGTAIQTGPNLTFSDGTANNTVALQNSQGRFGIWNYGAGAWNERLSVDSSGNVGIGVTPAGTGGCLQLKSGITFPATQVASSDANTLDDYEEGTFTPAITGSTTAGTATYVGRNGKYTKIGNQVHVQIFIDYNSHTGTGDTRITGLPFTNGANFSGAVVGYANAITISAGYYLAAYVDGGQSYILLNQIPTGGGTNQTVPIDAAGTLVVSATYTV